MKSFRQYTEELTEALVTFGGRAYPKNDHAVILAGGAGSGKGFVLSKLIGIEGKVFDVDEIKKMMLKHDKIRASFKTELDKLFQAGKLDKVPDVDDPKLLRNPAAVSALHATNKKFGIHSKMMANFFASMSPKSKFRQNVIFDVTLKDITKLHNLSQTLTRAGYEKKNIHLVWIVNDVKVAMEQNKSRDRVVPEDIFMATHEGASRTMASLIKDSQTLRTYMDGDVWIVPNKRNISSKWIPGKNKDSGHFAFADTFKIKASGKPLDISMMTKKLESKIPTLLKNVQDFVPKGTFNIKKKK